MDGRLSKDLRARSMLFRTAPAIPLPLVRGDPDGEWPGRCRVEFAPGPVTACTTLSSSSPAGRQAGYEQAT